MTLTRTGKLTLVLAALGAVTVLACVIADVPPVLRLLAGGGAVLVYVLLGWLLRRNLAEESRIVAAVADGIVSLRDQDYSVSVASPDASSPTRRLVDAYNGIGQVLRTQRQDLYQRELLLDTVIQATPLALVLTNPHGTVLYANLAARQVFADGRRLEGLPFASLLDAVPSAMRAAFSDDRDSLFTVDFRGESQVFHLSQRRFLLNGQSHRLYLLKQLTRELNAREVATWKRVIRVIAHEINNSVAPIASLAQSGQRLALTQDEAQLQRVFGAIEERMAHLAGFVEGYSRFAKLPRPRPAVVHWPLFIERLRTVAPFEVSGPLPDKPGWFDEPQLQQVLLNLIKNSHGAGSSPASIHLSVAPNRGGVLLELGDRGTGMSEEVLANALLPFYSTKASGTGLGLTLCREIVEAHGGTLDAGNRPGGGVIVRVWLPAPAAS
jgi:two-component system, NtrC family, nitrogen regulation sensor histidine kinase NtrY